MDLDAEVICRTCIPIVFPAAEPDLDLSSELGHHSLLKASLVPCGRIQNATIVSTDWLIGICFSA
jgi:hypothetical protein